MTNNPERLAEVLRQAGIRPSPQRLAVYRYVSEFPQHPSAEKIYRALKSELPGISLTTIYNTLKVLNGAGIISEVLVEDGEVRFDACTEPHAHFKCLKCGKIFDLPTENFPKIKGDGKDFVVLETHLFYKGLCPECGEKK